MKTSFIGATVLAAALLTGVNAADSTRGERQPVMLNVVPSKSGDQQVTLDITSEQVELAQGYEQTFAALNLFRTVIVVQLGPQQLTLRELKSLKANRGLLQAELKNGDKYVFDPRKVVIMADGPIDSQSLPSDRMRR